MTKYEYLSTRFLSIDYEDEDSDSDVPPEPPRQTKSGRLTQKPKVYVPIVEYRSRALKSRGS